MTEPQVWVFMGMFASFAFATLGVISSHFTRVLRSEIGGLRGEMRAEIGGLRGEMTAEIGGLRGEMTARFEAVHARFDAVNAEMNARFAAVDARFDAVHTKIDHLDADVAALTRRMLGDHD